MDKDNKSNIYLKIGFINNVFKPRKSPPLKENTINFCNKPAQTQDYNRNWIQHVNKVRQQLHKLIKESQTKGKKEARKTTEHISGCARTQQVNKWLHYLTATLRRRRRRRRMGTLCESLHCVRWKIFRQRRFHCTIFYFVLSNVLPV